MEEILHRTPLYRHKVRTQVVLCCGDAYERVSYELVNNMESARWAIINYMENHDWLFSIKDIEKIKTLEPLQNNKESCRLINLVLHSIIGNSNDVSIYIKIEDVYKYEVEND